MYNNCMDYDAIGRRIEDVERIKRLRLIDDDFMNVCFDNFVEGAELLLHIILGRDDIKVCEVHAQKVLKNLSGHDIWLDILATDSKENVYNFEIQRTDKGAHCKRARYHSSLIDSHMLQSGCEFTDLRENYVIFITENDVLGGKKPLYRIERKIIDTDEFFNDGEHIVYVNGEAKDQTTELGKLMHDFYCRDSKDIVHKVLSDRVKYFKEDEKGVDTMCEVFEEVRREGMEKGEQIGIEKGEQIGIEKGKDMERRKGAINLLSLGKLSYEEISSAMGLTIDEVRELAENMSA